MTEHPILFSAPMVRAILAGTKTQTRRIVKPQPRRVDGGVPFGDGPAWAHAEPASAMIRCPYGTCGDRLWVRETWRERVPDQDGHTLDYRADHEPGEDPCTMPWRPSIHMPRAASRITLEISGVVVERLQAICEHDARAEGVGEVRVSENDCRFEDYRPAAQRCSFGLGNARNSFWTLWSSINGADSWAANPWVWVVKFKRIEVSQ